MNDIRTIVSNLDKDDKRYFELMHQLMRNEAMLSTLLNQLSEMSGDPNKNRNESNDFLQKELNNRKESLEIMITSFKK